MITCKKCGAEKPGDQMKPRGGAPSKVCIECDEKARKEKARIKKVLANARSESVRTRKKKAKRASPAPRAEAPEALELDLPAGGHGVAAKITEECLLITQQNPGGSPDEVLLTKHEAKSLFDKFGLWIVGD